MNLYKISWSGSDEYWDTYDSAVVIANSKEEAKKITPDFDITGDSERIGCWTVPENVSVELIGVADEKYLESMQGKVNVISSFNAG